MEGKLNIVVVHSLSDNKNWQMGLKGCLVIQTESISVIL